MSKRRIDQLLVERGLFESRAKARAAIEAGLVLADGRAIVRPSDLVGEAAELQATPAHPWVGRGALKLAHALELWRVPVSGQVVIDVGASTGGFTQVCLANGASKVFAVDVGRGQLHASLVADPRVIDLSSTDARDLSPDLIATPPTLIVSDVSFISLTKALPVALALAGVGAELIALVKPQFEAGPAAIGKGGLVRDEAVRLQVLDQVCAWLEGQGWAVQASTDSPIAGGDGNLEYLVWAKKRPLAEPAA